MFAGRPEQLSVKFMAGLVGANSVIGITKLCPRVTESCEGGRAKPATTIERGLEFSGANFESPSYCATMEFCPASREEVVVDACPPPLSVPDPREIPLAKNVTAPEGDPEPVLVTVAESVTGC